MNKKSIDLLSRTLPLENSVRSEMAPNASRLECKLPKRSARDEGIRDSTRLSVVQERGNARNCAPIPARTITARRFVNFGRFLAERRSTPIWCRSATISTWRAACERQTKNIVERKGHRTLNIGLASQDFGKPNDLRKIGVSENHSSGTVATDSIYSLRVPSATASASSSGSTWVSRYSTR